MTEIISGRPARLTLDKSDKLRRKSEFDYVRAQGRKQVGRYFLLVVAPALTGQAQCGVICGRKFSLRAVDRNRARRLMWESFRLLKPWIAPRVVVLIPRRAVLQSKQPQVGVELRMLLKRAGMWLADASTPPSPPCVAASDSTGC